jgi:hypothetical protein
MKPKYSSPRKKADFSPEERKLQLELLREARELCDPDYASRAAGFWLNHQAAPEMRPSA